MTLKQLTDYLKSKGIEETDEVDFITLWGCEDLQKAKVSRTLAIPTSALGRFSNGHEKDGRG
jgi:hypothetical protein